MLKRNKRTIKVFSIFFLFLILILAFYLSMNKKPSKLVQKPPKVYVSTVKIQELVDQISSIGTLVSNESILIKSNIKEFIENIHFKEGQFVEKDTLLVTLRHDEEKALIKQAKIDLEEQERELKRVTSLADKDAIAKNRYYEQFFKYNSSKSKLMAIEAKYKDYFINAPFSGVVGISQISIGSLVDSGIPITTLDDISVFSLKFTIPELYISDVKLGLKVFAYSNSFEDEVFQGKVEIIGTRVDPYTHSFIVETKIKNSEGLLHPGMFMSVKLILNEDMVILIPEVSIIVNNGNHFVVVVDSKGRTHRRKVDIGRRDNDGMIEILSNLNEGEKIIVDGVSKGFYGSFVTPIDLDKPSTKKKY